MDHLTIAETCATLHRSRWTIGRLIKNGELAATKEGHRVWVHRASLLRYIERNSITLTAGR